MRSVRRWLLFAALALAGVWIYAVAGSAARLLALLEGLDGASSVARVDRDETPLRPDEPTQGEGSQTFAEAAQSNHGPLLQQMPADDLNATQIMRLLVDEIGSDTDPDVADEFLRAFSESLDSQE